MFWFVVVFGFVLWLSLVVGCLLVGCLFSCLVLVIVVIARLWLVVSLFGLFCLGLVVY